MDNNSNFSNPANSANITAVEQVVEANLVNEVEEVDLSCHKYDYRTGNPAVYCGTYAKYNDGSLYGMWLDLSSFGDFDEFMEACRWLHRDEEDPELMFQDYENFPEEWYSESCMDEDTFDRILEFAALDEDEQEAFKAFLEVTCDDDADIDDFRERYCGQWDSEEEFAEHIVEETGMLDSVPEDVKRFFNFEAYADELFQYDYDFSSEGYVFRTC